MSLSPPYMNTIYDDIRSIVPNVFGPVQCVCNGRQMSNDEIIKYACVASHCTIIFICLVSMRSLHFFIFFLLRLPLSSPSVAADVRYGACVDEDVILSQNVVDTDMREIAAQKLCFAFFRLRLRRCACRLPCVCVCV